MGSIGSVVLGEAVATAVVVGVAVGLVVGVAVAVAVGEADGVGVGVGVTVAVAVTVGVGVSSSSSPQALSTGTATTRNTSRATRKTGIFFIVNLLSSISVTLGQYELSLDVSNYGIGNRHSIAILLNDL